MAADRLELLAELLAIRSPVEVVDPDRQRAAVALLLLDSPDRILLIRRAVRQRDHWSGQVALPGGRHDPVDQDLFATVLRETAEEVGVRPSAAEFVAQLDDFAPTIQTLPAMLVRPFLFRLTAEPTLVPNWEVAATAWVAFSDLAGRLAPHRIELMDKVRTVAGYSLPIGLLWGMTERIVTPIIAAWRQLPID